ncbi:MAG: tyrosine-type recombinase/integrase [Sphingomonadaceae bacterium]
MATIKKRRWESPSGEIKDAWQVDYRDQAGKRRSKQFARKKDAEAWLTQAAWHVSQGTHTPDSQSITVKKAGELWLARARLEALEPTTIASYDQHIRLHINPLCGEKKLSQLTKPIVEGYRDQLMGKLSRPMATRVLRSLTSIISEAQRRGHVAQNVAAGVRVRRVQREKAKVTIPTKVELNAMIEAARKSSEPMAWPLLTTTIFAGVRASELRGLPWRCVDLKSGTVTIEQRADAQGNIGAPKSASGRRSIPLPPTAIQALRAWKLQCPRTDDDLVFPSIGKKAMSHRYMTLNIFAPVQIASKVFDTVKIDDESEIQRPRYTLHELRHAAASLWIEQRVNPKRVQRWMGHSSIQVTFDTYGHLFDQADQDATVAAAIEREVLGAGDATPVQHGA